MKTFKCSEALRPWLIEVLRREHIQFQIQEETISVPLSGRVFHERVEQAGLEKDMAERMGLGPTQVFQNGKSCGIPVFNHRISTNEGRKRRLLREYHRTGCIIPNSDKEWYLKNRI